MDGRGDMDWGESTGPERGESGAEEPCGREASEESGHPEGREAWEGRGPAGFWSETGGALVIVALFVGLGLGGAALGGASSDAGPYPSPSMSDSETMDERIDDSPAEPRIWLVDGFNVLHAAVLKGRDRKEWWRGPARARVLDLAGGLPDPEAEIWVVFDGADPDEEAELPPRVRQVFAPSADDWLVRRVKEIPRGSPVSVVTADRQLAGRARHHGAEIVSPRAFAERCRETVRSARTAEGAEGSAEEA